jgi:hypothetical protein
MVFTLQIEDEKDELLLAGGKTFQWFPTFERLLNPTILISSRTGR